MNSFGAIGIVIGITNMAIGLLVFSYDRKGLNSQLWLLFAVSVSIWGFGSYMISISSDPQSALLWWRLTHIGVIVIPFSLLLFTHSFLGMKMKMIAGISLFLIAFFFLSNLSPYFISSVRLAFNSFYYDGPPTGIYNIFVSVFIAIMIYIVIISLRAYKSCSDPIRKQQILFFTLATFVGSVGGSTSFLPVYGLYVYPYLNSSIILFPFIIGYGILRHGLFNPKAIATELFVFCLWIFVLVRSLFSTNSSDVRANVGLLVLLVPIGIFLIRSVRKEVTAREHIQKLATDLEKANVRLTELDRQKSEFVSFATHQLRAPLTAMKGYGSLLLEGDMGQLPDQAKNGIQHIYDSANTLTNIVDDYLNVSRIELGTMKYTFETLNLKTLVEDVIAEIKPNIDRVGLKFSFTAEDHGTDYRITADRDKLKQVIANTIDNSVKYTPAGSVAASLVYDRAKHRFVFMVRDTGIGIDPEVLPHLFQKFSRAQNANKTNIKGTGLGLYVAKQIVDAHHGTIRAESAGEGKGSTFIVELEPFGKV